MKFFRKFLGFVSKFLKFIITIHAMLKTAFKNYAGLLEEFRILRKQTSTANSPRKSDQETKAS